MAEFSPTRPLSEQVSQIIATKPDYWEYTLTSTLIKDWILPIQAEWIALVSGRYADPSKTISETDAVEWLLKRFTTLGEEPASLSQLVNSDLVIAWGEPGVPGDADRILATCSAIADCCERILIWEESVRFNALPVRYQHFRFMMVGIAGPIISSVAGLSEWIDRSIIAPKPGVKSVTVVISLPEGWEDCFAHQIALLREGKI